MSLRSSVLSGYRDLLHTIRVVFGADRAAVLHCTREARVAFQQNRLISDPTKIQQMVSEISDARDFLRSNIAQARLNDAGRYG